MINLHTFCKGLYGYDLYRLRRIFFSSIFADTSSVCILIKRGNRTVFVSIIVLVTFAVSHLRLTIYCVSLKCVIASSWWLLLKVLSHTEEKKWTIFKNVFVVKSEMLKVNACAAPGTYQLGAMGEGSSQN